MSRETSYRGRSGFELCDGAFHLVRGAPLHVVSWYYIGSVPFIAGVLTFWGAMLQSAYAARELPAASLGLALLFIWMKAWQNRYCRGLMAELRGTPLERLGMAGTFRMAATQAYLHAAGLIALPCSILTMLPFAWTYAALQNVSVLDDGAPESARGLVGRAVAQAMRWPIQNHIAIWLLSPCMLLLVAICYLAAGPMVNSLGFLPIEVAFSLIASLLLILLLPFNPFGVAVAANLGVGILFGAQLLHSFFNVPSLFTDAPSAVFNSTFVAVVVALTYLCLDPFMKAAYVLRCFEGHAQYTGEDIKVRLRRISAAAGKGILLVLATLLLTASPAAIAQENQAERTAEAQPLDPAQLDAALDSELAHPRYTWRMPRVENLESRLEDMGIAGEVLQSISDAIKRAGDIIEGWIEKFFDWMDKRSKNSSSSSGWEGFSLAGIMPYVLALLVGVLTVALTLGLMRAWRARRDRQRRVAVESSSVTPAPDVADERVAADALPEDGWLALARELFDKGEYRLGIRALFLAMLARLAHEDLIRVARHKSNRDYRNEVARRAHVNPALMPAFISGIDIFEAVWYGGYDAAPPELRDAMLRQIETCRAAASVRQGDVSHA